MQDSQKLTGILLLRLLIDECSGQRFLQAFPAWGAKLVGMSKASTTTEIQRNVWAALRSLFLRIGQMCDLPGVRQEGSALAGKLAGALGPLLKQKPGKQQPPSTSCNKISLFTHVNANRLHLHGTGWTAFNINAMLCCR